METVKLSFGQKGGLLFAFLNVLQLVGWTAIMIYDGALAIGGIFPVGHWVWCAVIGGLIIVWIAAGVTNLGWMNRIAMAALLVLTVLLCKVIFFGNDPASVSGEAMSFGAAVELAVAMGAAIYTGESDIAQIMMRAGLGVAALVILVLSTVTTTFLDAWSAGISAESLCKNIHGRPTAIAVTAAGILGAILFPMDDITGFLYLIGSVFAPMVAVQIADHFLLRRDRSSAAYDGRNLSVWLIGFVLYRLLMRLDIPVGCTLADMALTVALCLLADMVFRRGPHLQKT